MVPSGELAATKSGPLGHGIIDAFLGGREATSETVYRNSDGASIAHGARL